MSIACVYAYDNIWISALGISVNGILDSGNKIIIEVDGKEYDNVFLVNYDFSIRSYNVAIYIVSNECKELIFSKVLNTMYLKTFIINEVAKTAQVNFIIMAAISYRSDNYNCIFAINHSFEKKLKVEGQIAFYNIKRDGNNNIINYNSLEDIRDEYGNIIPSKAHEYYMASFQFSDSKAYTTIAAGDLGYTYSSGYIKMQFYTNRGPTAITRPAFNNTKSTNIGGNIYKDEFTANIPYYEYVLE